MSSAPANVPKVVMGSRIMHENFLGTINKLDVSVTDYVTLGGATSASATANEIALSKSRAIRLLFGLRGINNGASAYTPVQRALLKTSDVAGEVVAITNGFFFEPKAALHRFYHGSVDSESNFVGFGMTEFEGWIQETTQRFRCWSSTYDPLDLNASSPTQTTLFGFPFLTWDNDPDGSGSLSITSFDFFNFI